MMIVLCGEMMLVYNPRLQILGIKFQDIVLVEDETVYMVFTNEWEKVGWL